MQRKSVLATIVGWGLIFAAILAGAFDSIAHGTREQALNSAAFLAAAAFIATLAYEDWRDAQRNGRSDLSGRF